MVQYSSSVININIKFLRDGWGCVEMIAMRREGYGEEGVDSEETRQGLEAEDGWKMENGKSRRMEKPRQGPEARRAEDVNSE